MRQQDNQVGFRPGRGSADQIFMLKRFLEHRFKYITPASFVSSIVQLPSIQLATLWRVMEHDGVPKRE
ncbi:unnamed protein product [Dracunculus medinensis]|uniref:Reverse transcriptase domain-containing protein n=1 Tax=Dracunculus medinensis TaxID=318479 RepID=A0A0N4U4D9_DRAME|nr:unnamed protein product [Dracunculus medinensis]